MLDAERVGPGLGAEPDLGERIFLDFVSAVVETRRDGELLHGVEFDAPAVGENSFVDGVGRLLEGALGEVERVEQHLVTRVVGVFERKEVHLEERLAVPEAPREQGLNVHGVHGYVPAGERYAGGVAAERKIWRTRHVLVVVFLGILVRAALHAKVERERIRDEPPEIQVKRVTAEGAAFPGDVRDGSVDGNAVAFLEEDAVFAVERETRRVEPEARGIDARKHCGVTATCAGKPHGRGREFRVPEDGGSERPFRLLARDVVEPLHDFGVHEPETARVVLAYLRVEAVGDDHDGILAPGLLVLRYGLNLREGCGG